MALPVKQISQFIFFVLVVTIVLAAASSIIPIAQQAGNELNDTNQCNVNPSCFYNQSVDPDIPCRDLSNQSLVCSVPNSTVPLSGLFSGNGIFFILVSLAIFLGIFLALNLGKSKK